MNILVRKLRLNVVRSFCKSKTVKPVSPSELIALASQQPSANYSTALTVFSKLLSKGYLDDHKTLTEVMAAMNNYPVIDVEQQAVDEIYQIVQPVIHQLNSQTIMTMFIFLSKCDKNLQTSLIYDHVLKYYLKNRYEIYKSRLGIDTSTNITTIIRKLISRILTMGLALKMPPYEKTLMIPQQLRLPLLQNLLRQSWNNDSLLIRKIYYQWFNRLKQYYEDQMRQNLYHEKNADYMKDLCQYSVVLSSRCQIIEEQNSLMRQLFLKMYQVMKQQGRPILHTYKLCRLLNAVNMQPQDIKSLILTRQYIDNCGYEETIQLIKHHRLELSDDLPLVFDKLLTPQIVFHTHDIIDVIRLNQQFPTLFQKYIGQMHQMKLEQTLQLGLALIKSKKCLQQLLVRILKIQQAQVSHQNVKDMLMIINNAEMTPEREAIRCYVFKYLSDHHRQFPLPLYKQCLEIIHKMEDGRKVFDSSGAYRDILSELSDYNKQLQ